MAKQEELKRLREQARKALSMEYELLAVKLSSSFWRGIDPGGIEDWSEALSAIEGVGWRLEQWTVVGDGNNAPQAFPVFRRRRMTPETPEARQTPAESSEAALTLSEHPYSHGTP